jgi:hypothetical protein
MLKEKQSYDFKVVRVITLPDDTRSWVLTHTGADRYMLPYELYTDYGIAEGMIIRCRVDKINCTGRIFLEPEHPYYREGEHYSFTLLGESRFEDEAGNRMQQLELAGHHGDYHHHIKPESAHHFAAGDKIEVQILSIRKGSLQLTLVHSDDQTTMQPGELYPFVITEEAEAGYWTIQGPYGIKARLQMCHYLDHGLSVGSSFTGYFQRWQERGMPLIEPEHPVYRPGRVYLFDVHALGEIDPSDDHEGSFLIVTDCFGHQIKVYQNEPHLPGEGKSDKIRCRVVRLKRGIPVLRAL